MSFYRYKRLTMKWMNLLPNNNSFLKEGLFAAKRRKIF